MIRSMKIPRIAGNGFLRFSGRFNPISNLFFKIESLSSTASVDATTNEHLSENGANGLRLAVAIAETNLFSRRMAEYLVNQRRVTIAGKIAPSPAAFVSPNDLDLIEIDGVRLCRKYSTNWPRLWAIEKLKGEAVTSQSSLQSEDGTNLNSKKHSRSFLHDRLRSSALPSQTKEYGPLKPVYYLNYNAEGLMLVTNSGMLAKFLDSSANNLSKQFRVRVHGLITDSKLKGLRKGLTIENNRYSPISDISVQKSAGTNSWLSLSTTEKRPDALHTCFKKLYLDITRIICTGFGPFKFDDYFPRKAKSASVDVHVSPYRELRLPPELHAKFLRVINANFAQANNFDQSKVANPRRIQRDV